MQGSRLLLHEGGLISFVSPLLTPTRLVTTSAVILNQGFFPQMLLQTFHLPGRDPDLKSSGPQGKANVES